jgi:hypothetical protein
LTGLPTWRHRLAGPGIGALLLVASGVAVGGEPIELVTRAVPLHAEEPSVTSVDRLSYRGGIEIASTDRRFGGWSGLLVSPDGENLFAVSDTGKWLNARLRYGTDGRLVGLADGILGELKDGKGNPLRGREADAEALTRLGDTIVIAFERHARLAAYPARGWREPIIGTPRPFPRPRDLLEAPGNGGMEALTAISGNRLFAVAEAFDVGDGAARAWLHEGGRWHDLTYAWTGRFRAADATTLPSGDVLVLERRFTWVGAFASRIVRIAQSAIRPGAHLEGVEIAVIDPPLSAENFEAVAARRGRPGETLIYLLSDDNFLFVQRTLLLMFALRE